MKLGENPKMPYPQCGRSIKTYARGNHDAPSISKYGSLVRPDAQIVALCAHCAEGMLDALTQWCVGQWCVGPAPKRVPPLSCAPCEGLFMTGLDEPAHYSARCNVHACALMCADNKPKVLQT